MTASGYCVMQEVPHSLAYRGHRAPMCGDCRPAKPAIAASLFRAPLWLVFKACHDAKFESATQPVFYSQHCQLLLEVERAAQVQQPLQADTVYDASRSKPSYDF
jgi:hypothetical protein